MKPQQNRRRTQVVVVLVMIGVLLVVGVPQLLHGTLFATSSRPQAITLPKLNYSGFDPNKLISDADFYNPDALSEQQIRHFIAGVGADCEAGSDDAPCLREVRVVLPDFPADKFCQAIAGRAEVDAATLLSEVSRACGISPAALLVMLQKEQGLLTASGAGLTPRRYQAAMGYACPENAPCDPVFAGLVNQVYYGARQFKLYRDRPEKYEFAAGKTSRIFYSTDPGCGETTVTPVNDATAGLYNYTPHTPHPETLAGNPPECETWGNLNFYAMYQSWLAPQIAQNATAE